MWLPELLLPRWHRTPPRPPGPTAGVVVATYNVHSGTGADGSMDLDRLAGVIRGLGASVVALQEVAGHGVPTSWVDHLDYLEALLGQTAIPGPTLVRRGGRFGNAVLTSLPVLRNRQIDLSVAGREPRGALDLTVRVAPGAHLRVVATHLGLRRRERRRQLARITGVTSGERGPVVIMGDFNEWKPGGSALRGFHLAGGMVSPRTFPTVAPLFALDRILVRPRHILTHAEPVVTPLTRAASDHYPLRARLEVPVATTG